MIERVQFQNFKALQDVSLDLSRLTVLVGPNGSGKTSVLEGMKYLGRVNPYLKPKVADVFDDVPDATRLRNTSGDGILKLTWYEPESWVAFAAGPRAGAWLESLEGKNALSEWSGTRFGETGFAVKTPWPSTVEDGAVKLLHLDPRELIAPIYDSREVPRVEPNGAGLTSVLSHLASADPETFTKLLDAVGEIIPNVQGMRFPRAPVKRTETEVITVDGKPFTHRAEKEYWGNSIEFDMENAPGIPASMVSEGTLLVLGLLTVILGPGRPRLLLLDDIDRALHPKAQGDLVALLRRLLDKFAEMQIVATSHSPYLLDHLHPEEIRLTTLKADGTVAAGRLDEHPEFEKWRETMTPGEFWSMVGESWLVDVRAGDLPSGERS